MPLEAKKPAGTVEMRPRERRLSPRYPLTAAAEVVDLDSSIHLSARTADLGRGGCFIDASNPFPVGTRVALRLTMEQRTFQAQALVVYALPGMGMGLAFTRVEPQHIWVLEKWLGQTAGEMPPAAATALFEPPPQQAEVKEEEPAGSPEPAYVLNELIITLMRKKILTESEGKLLLRKLVG